MQAVQDVGAGRSNAAGRVGAAVEDGLGRDKERTPPLTRDETGEQGDQRVIILVEAWPGHLPAQHGQLVAQHEDLSVLGDGVHSVDARESKGTTDEAVEEADGHGQQHGTARVVPGQTKRVSYWTPHVACIDESKMAKVPRPFDFALYMAMSASRSTSSGRS